MQGNKYWYSENPFAQAGFGLPNCTCYAWGRRYEIEGKPPVTSLGNADTWYDFAIANNQKVGDKPELGAIMVWKYSGSHAGEGGHVAIVEEIREDGTIVTSNSAYGGAYFYTQELKPPYEWSAYTVFQGFIYLTCRGGGVRPPKPPHKQKKKNNFWMYLFP